MRTYTRIQFRFCDSWFMDTVKSVRKSSQLMSRMADVVSCSTRDRHCRCRSSCFTPHLPNLKSDTSIRFSNGTCFRERQAIQVFPKALRCFNLLVWRHSRCRGTITIAARAIARVTACTVSWRRVRRASPSSDEGSSWWGKSAAIVSPFTAQCITGLLSRVTL